MQCFLVSGTPLDTQQAALDVHSPSIVQYPATELQPPATRPAFLSVWGRGQAINTEGREAEGGEVGALLV